MAVRLSGFKSRLRYHRRINGLDEITIKAVFLLVINFRGSPDLITIIFLDQFTIFPQVLHFEIRMTIKGVLIPAR